MHQLILGLPERPDVSITYMISCLLLVIIRANQNIINTFFGSIPSGIQYGEGKFL